MDKVDKLPHVAVAVVFCLLYSVAFLCVLLCVALCGTYIAKKPQAMQDWDDGLHYISLLISISGLLCLIGFPLLMCFFWGYWGFMWLFGVALFFVLSWRFEVACRKEM
jgi:hypothetical protein